MAERGGSAGGDFQGEVLPLDFVAHAASLGAHAGRARMFVTNGTSLCASPARESTYRALESGAKVVLDVDYRSMC